jgi:hypothetical protein
MCPTPVGSLGVVHAGVCDGMPGVRPHLCSVIAGIELTFFYGLGVALAFITGMLQRAGCRRR